MLGYAIDIGNTTIKIGKINTLESIEVEKYNFTEKNKLTLYLDKIEHSKPVIISDVTNNNLNIINNLTKINNNVIILNHNTPIPIKLNYKTPETLGSDRLACAVGANELFPNKNILIIDAGTCIKYDYISSENIFFGGIISPGISMRFKALNHFTKKLPLCTLKDINFLVGQTTEESILSGVINGIIAEMNGIIDKYIYEKKIDYIILTGGDYKFFVEKLKKTIFVYPFLTMIGLAKILIFNVKK